MHRDTEHFALELSPTDDDTQIHNTALNFVGLSLLLPPSLDEPQNGSVDSDPIARFLAQRAKTIGDDGSKQSIRGSLRRQCTWRSILTFRFTNEIKELLHRTAWKFCSVLHMMK